MILPTLLTTLLALPAASANPRRRTFSASNGRLPLPTRCRSTITGSGEPSFSGTANLPETSARPSCEGTEIRDARGQNETLKRVGNRRTAGPKRATATTERPFFGGTTDSAARHTTTISKIRLSLVREFASSLISTAFYYPAPGQIDEKSPGTAPG